MKRAPSSTTLFFALLSVFAILFSTWLMFSTFSYEENTRMIEIAAKCWSDFGAHIPMIRSFSLGANLDRIAHFQLPEYPIFPGEPIRYHFIFYMFVGILEKLGVRIDWALNSLSIIGFAGLLICIALLSYKLFRNRTVTILSVLFFLFNGSLSFLSFFKKNPLSLTTPMDIMTNDAFPSFGPWDGGLVSAFWNLNIYTNQRHLAMGFALGLLFIELCLFVEHIHAWKKQLPYLFLTAPILIMLPYFHQPMLIVIGLCMIWYVLVFPKLRIFLLLTGLLSVGPIAIQLRSFIAGTSSFAWYPGYLAHENLTPLSFVIYWFYNLGAHTILIPIGFLLVPWKTKKIIMPAFFLFVIANLFKFSVEVAANHKFFNFFMIFGNMLSAYTIIFLWQIIHTRIGGPPSSARNPAVCNNTLEREKTGSTVVRRVMQTIFGYAGRGRRTGEDARIKKLMMCSAFLFFPLLLSLTLSGIIDFFAIYNDRKIPIPDIPRNEVATWIQTNTPKDAVILNTSYLYNPASIAGRSIFLGWPYFAWSAGYEENRMPIMRQMYESKNPNIFCPLFQKYRISFVTVEAISGDRDLPTIDPVYFRSLAKPAFITENGSYAIYTTLSLCP